MDLNGNEFLIKYLGIVFVLASIYRCFIKEQREEELKLLNLPYKFDYLIIIIEFIFGVILLFFKDHVIITLELFLLFLIIGCVSILINNFDSIMNEFSLVWTFQSTSMSLVFHLTYIVMIIGILLNITKY